MFAWLHELDLRSAVGWALLNAVWQGFLVFYFYRLARLCTARSAVRYLVGNTCLVVFVAAQALTLAYCVAADLHPRLLEDVPLLAPSVDPLPLGAGDMLLVRAVPIASWWARAASVAEPYLPWVCLLWAVGVTLRAAQAAGAMLLLNRELGRCLELAEPLRLHAAQACGRLRITRPVRFLQSTRVSVPATAGWLRPVVLVPTAALLRLRPEHLEAMLLHELAHVVRNDYLTNLLRSWVEAVYFFHPLLRRLSQYVAHDAEEATDEIAARACGSARTYAEALLTLEECRPTLPGLLGIDGNARPGDLGGSLGARVRNLLANRAALGRGQLQLSAAGPFFTALLVVALLSQTLAVAAGDRTMTSRARAQSLVHAVLSDVAHDRDRPAAAEAIAAAVNELRASGDVAKPTLVALAKELLQGVRGDLLTDLGDLPADVPLQRGLSPLVVARFGSFAERGHLIARLRDAAVATRDRSRRRDLARAALCLAYLDRATVNGGSLLGSSRRAASTQLLLQPTFVRLLQLTAGQQRRLDLAVRADNERAAGMMRMTLNLVESDRGPTRADLADFARVMSLTPYSQTATARCLPLEVHRALTAYVRNDGNAPPPSTLAHMLRVADAALARPDAYRPRHIDVVPRKIEAERTPEIR